MRHGKESDAEEARIVLNIFHDNLAVAQRVRRLQFITRIGHLRHQCADPGVKLQFQYAAVFGGTDILALDDFQVMRNAGQQENIGQTGVNTTVGGGVSGIIQRRFWAEFAEKKQA